MVEVAKERKSTIEDYERWHNLLQEKLNWRQNYWNGDNAWVKWIRLDTGHHWDDISKDAMQSKSSDNPATKITINKIGPYVRLLVSFLLSRPPKVMAEPRKPESVTNAILAARALDYEYQMTASHKTNRSVIHDGVVIGHGISKIGYSQDIDETARPDSDGYIEYRDFVKKDSPYHCRVSPFLFLFDTSGRDRSLNSARWCAEYFYETPYFVLNNIRYDRDVQRDIRANREKPFNYVTSLTPEKMKNAGYDSEEELWELCEVWDKHFRRHYIFCKGVTRPLIDEPWPYDHLDSFPYLKWDFIECINEPYGLGFPAWLEDPQLETNRIRSHMFTYRRRIVGGKMYFPADIDKTERDKYEAGGDVIVGPQGTPPTPIAYPALPKEEYAFQQVADADMEFIGAINELLLGASAGSRASATETRIRADFAMLRIDLIRQSVDSLITDELRQMLKHMQAYYVVERLVDIAGPLAYYWGKVKSDSPPDAFGKYWVPFTKEDIKGEFEVTIETTAKPKKDPTVETQQRLAYGQYLMGHAQFSLTLSAAGADIRNVGGVDLVELAKWIGESFEFKDLSRLIRDAAMLPPPLMEATQQGQQPAALAAPSFGAPLPSGAPPSPNAQATFGQAVSPESELLSALQSMQGQ